MKKSRFLVCKLTIFIFTFLIAYSCFFYVPIEALARAEYSSSFENWGSTSDSGLRFYTIDRSLNKFSLSDVDDNKFYYVSLKTSVEFDSTQALNFRIPYISVGDSLAWIGTNQNNVMSYTDSSTKDLVFLGSDLKNGLDVKVKMYLFRETDLDFRLEGLVSIDVISLMELGESPLDSYNSGYDAGYAAGEEFGYSDGYSNGYLDGQSSGYESGFNSGVDSVDTDSYFMQGYEAGREVAYVEGFDEGYLQGYAEALTVDSSNSTTLEAGAVQNYSLARDLKIKLNDSSFNTIYPTTVIGSDFGYSDEGMISGDNDSYLSLEHWTYGEGYSSNIVFGYNITTTGSIFTTSSDVYAYKIVLKPTKHIFDSFCVKLVVPMVGFYSDLVRGIGECGISVELDSYSHIWFVNDGRSLPLYLGFLSRFHTQGDEAFYNLNFSYNFEVIPYTKKEYNASVNAIEKQTVEMKQQFYDLKNGYDSSAGQAMNDNFEASLMDYDVAQDSLFSTAAGGLSDFEFFDFESVPAVVTGISFITTVMTGIFNAMGGLSGAGIVLSVLFSVMLVSMILGLYRFYQSASRRGGKGGKGG